MPVTFVDQLMAFVSTPVNLTTFIADTGIAAYAGASFTRRYGQSGFQVDSVALGTPVDFELQQPILDDLRIMGTEQRTDSSSGRKLYDLRYHRQQVIGWVDASFTVPADFNAELIPGSAPLGPGGSVTQGTTTSAQPGNFQMQYLVGLTTGVFTLSYPLRVSVFASADLSPTADLQRIRQVRRFLESDPAFLESLDGSTDQRPLLFVQIYPGAAADGAPITAQAVGQLFDADDILATFFTLPA